MVLIFESLENVNPRNKVVYVIARLVMWLVYMYVVIDSVFDTSSFIHKLDNYISLKHTEIYSVPMIVD